MAETLVATADFTQSVIVFLGMVDSAQVCAIVAGETRLIRVGRPPPLLQSESLTRLMLGVRGVSGAPGARALRRRDLMQPRQLF